MSCDMYVTTHMQVFPTAKVTISFAFLERWAQEINAQYRTTANKQTNNNKNNNKNNHNHNNSKAKISSSSSTSRARTSILPVKIRIDLKRGARYQEKASRHY